VEWNARPDLDAIAGAGIPHKREPLALVVESRRFAGAGARAIASAQRDPES
jgi:hypothetical protein